MFDGKATIWRRLQDGFSRAVIKNVQLEETEANSLGGSAQPLPSWTIRAFLPIGTSVELQDFIAAGEHEEDIPCASAHEVKTIRRWHGYGIMSHIEVQG